jgi:hypothetical protein
VAIAKGKPNAGQGGKRGHSNQDHWDYTEAVKAAARKQRRLDAKIEIKDGLEELDENQSALNRSPTVREGSVKPPHESPC